MVLYILGVGKGALFREVSSVLIHREGFHCNVFQIGRNQSSI